MLHSVYQRFKKLAQNLLSTLIRKVIILTVIFILIGTFGFYFFEFPQNTLLESFYWTVITITTIGFGDITPLTMHGQVLAIVLAFFGVALISLTLAIMMEMALDSRFFSERKYLKRVRKMDEVTLICGFNERIKILIQELSTEGIKIVLVNKDSIPDEWDDNWGAYIRGDAIEDNILLKAGVERAKKALVSLDDDGDTLLAILSIESLNKNCYKIAEVKNKGNIKHFDRIKCDQIICQEEIIGKFLNITLLLPELFPAYNELISMEGNEIYHIRQIDDYIDKTFEETMSSVKRKDDALLIGLVRENKTFLNPNFDEKIRKDDILVVIAETFVE